MNAGWIPDSKGWYIARSILYKKKKLGNTDTIITRQITRSCYVHLLMPQGYVDTTVFPRFESEMCLDD
jgi:hypothetical protein